MTRFVNTPPTAPDKYSDRVAKYIPAEVLSAYVAMTTISEPSVAEANKRGELLHTYIGKMVNSIPETARSGLKSKFEGSETYTREMWKADYEELFSWDLNEGWLMLRLAFWICLVATPLYFYFLGKFSDGRLKPSKITIFTQIAVCTVAFVVWAYALGGFFSYYPVGETPFHRPVVSGCALVIFTLVAGLINPPVESNCLEDADTQELNAAHD
ncbi:hypothetical protein [Rosistilla oblonga]|uniref:hypothetical protein n=1 Tax=Rosistilla oblonga TaxID=2527990 RepID=UPI003A983017